MAINFFPGSQSQGLVAVNSTFCPFAFNNTALTVNTNKCLYFATSSFSSAFNNPFTRIVLIGEDRLELI